MADAVTGKLITASNPAHAGENVVVYMTGLGALTGAHGEHSRRNVSVTIGSVPVVVSATDPATGATAISNTVTIAVQ